MRASVWFVGPALAIGLVAVACGGSPAAEKKSKAPAKEGATLPDTSDASRSLTLVNLDLNLVYDVDFSRPLKFVKESALFADGKRARKPEGVDWVLEGQASAAAEGNRLILRNEGGHLVLWNTREFPADFLLEFGMSPADSSKGLAIVFFAAKGLKGESIFDLGQPMRDGDFKMYHSGSINCYHTSYWATDEQGQARETAHIRKNKGFYLVAKGKDFIAGQRPGFHRIRMLKVGGKIEVEADSKIEVQWTDDGKTHGPVLSGGLIGLRQMDYSTECRYTHFKVWEVRPK